MQDAFLLTLFSLGPGATFSPMKKPVALFALAVMAWSNATALHCTPQSDGVVTTETEAHAGHLGHGRDLPPPADSERSLGSADGPNSHPTGLECGAMMPCGVAVTADVPAVQHTPPAGADARSTPVFALPATVDLPGDTPPPRRLA